MLKIGQNSTVNISSIPTKIETSKQSNGHVPNNDQLKTFSSPTTKSLISWLSGLNVTEVVTLNSDENNVKGTDNEFPLIKDEITVFSSQSEKVETMNTLSKELSILVIIKFYTESEFSSLQKETYENSYNKRRIKDWKFEDLSQKKESVQKEVDKLRNQFTSDEIDSFNLTYEDMKLLMLDTLKAECSQIC
jgi:hypothetical protein